MDNDGRESFFWRVLFSYDSALDPERISQLRPYCAFTFPSDSADAVYRVSLEVGAIGREGRSRIACCRIWNWRFHNYHSLSALGSRIPSILPASA